MQLGIARLCLDCEEVHESQQCPACASESFAYLTRWVPADERWAQTRAAAAGASRPSRLIRRGAAGLALMAVSAWLLRVTTKKPPHEPK